MGGTAADGFRRRLLAMRASLEATEEASREATRTVVLDQASVGRLSVDPTITRCLRCAEA